MMSGFIARVPAPLLLLLLLSLSFVFASTVADCKKELPVNTPFPQPILGAMSCDVCAYTIINFQHQLQAARVAEEAKGLVLHEDGILSLLEKICNPFKEEGEWIRRVVLEVRPDSPTEPLGADVLSYFGMCKRTCSSITDICERLLDDAEADKLPMMMLKLMKQHRDISAEHVTEEVVQSICHPMDLCTRKAAYQKQFGEEIAREPHGRLRKLLAADAPEEIDGENMEMERMMQTMGREQGKKTDIFPRSEIMDMQNAIRRGDREAVASIDPSISDLTDEEFEELRQLFIRDSANYGGPTFDDEDDL